MNLVDSHCHLNYLENDPHKYCLRAVFERAAQVGVHHCLCISVDLENIPDILRIANTYEHVKATIGVHPCDVYKTPDDTMGKLRTFIVDDQVVAVGETGLDYYHEASLDKQKQKKYFAEQIHLANEYARPLVVHSRQAREDTIALIRDEGGYEARGVLHCFTETLDMAKKALDLGFYISFSGIITFKNAQEIRDVCAYCPMDRILLETDAPYLAPVPYRGKTNEPAYVLEVAKQVAAVKQLPLDVVATQTTQNVQALFQWPVLDAV